MDWTKVLYAVLLAGMIIFLWPHASRMLEESKQAENKDWQGALLPLGAVVIFVILLIAMTRS